MLVQMTQRLRTRHTFEEVIRTILEDVCALHGAEHGNVQLASGDDVVIAVHRGFSPGFLQSFRRVKKDDGSACGRALRHGEPVVIADVDQDPEYAPFRQAAKMAGYRAVQSTPLLTKNRDLLGIVSTHFALAHVPTPIEMQTLKDYSVVAAEYAFELLGDDTLAARAERMSEELYAHIYA